MPCRPVMRRLQAWLELAEAIEPEPEPQLNPSAE
jgi:hypothetical protein